MDWYSLFYHLSLYIFIIMIFVAMFYLLYRENTKSWGLSEKKTAIGDASKPFAETISHTIRWIFKLTIFFTGCALIIRGILVPILGGGTIGQIFGKSAGINSVIILTIVALVPIIFGFALIWIAIRIK